MVLLVVLSISVFADGFIIQGQYGIGGAVTDINGKDFTSNFTDYYDFSHNLGLKAGYGPFGKVPLYAVFNFSLIGYRVYDDYKHIHYNSYMAGPGVLFYPHPLVQLGFSIGPSYIFNSTVITETSELIAKDDGVGVAIDGSVAVDIGHFLRSTRAKNFGLSIGIDVFSTFSTLKYSGFTLKYSGYTLKESGYKEISTSFTLYMALAYRHPPKSLFSK